MTQHLENDWLEITTAHGRKLRVLKRVHPRSRRLRLTVTTQGARVTCPPGTHPAQVGAFLRAHADWLAAKLDELHLSARPLPALRVGQELEIPLRGERVALRWLDGPYPRVVADAVGLTVVLPRPHQRALELARGLVVGHLETLIRRDVARWLGPYVEALQRAPSGFRVRPMKSLWGSLDTRDQINLDLALALAPPAALRYVLVHELCHLRVRNHSPRFWTRVEQSYPAWRDAERWLKQNGSLLGL